MSEINRIEELEKRIEMLEFRQQLLFDNDDLSRLLFEYNITHQQYRDIMDLMDSYRDDIDHKRDVNNSAFEDAIYKIVPEHSGDYHMCEYIARAFMDTGRWEEVFPALYGDMPKYKFLMEEKMIDIGDIVGNIASVCSIIGLPIALYQISGIKSKAEATEAGLNRLLEMKENENLEQICTQIFNQQQELAQIQASIGKEGIKPKRQDEKCKSIINELNQCIFQIPVKYEEATKSLEECIACLQDYLKNNSGEKLKEASDYLYTILRGLKKAKEKNINEQLKDIAHQ